MKVEYRGQRMTTKVRRHRRSGTTAVEFAFTAPILFLMVFGFIELGRAMFVINAFHLAAASGCRVATLPGADATLVRNTIDAALASTCISRYEVTLTPSDLSRSSRDWSMVSVVIASRYADVSWVPVPKFLADKVLRAACSLPREIAN
jgi:Flp pilus assembly protein TadG